MFNDICCRMTTCYLKNAVNPKILLVVQFRVFAPAMLTRMIGNSNGARGTTREKKKMRQTPAPNERDPEPDAQTN